MAGILLVVTLPRLSTSSPFFTVRSFVLCGYLKAHLRLHQKKRLIQKYTLFLKMRHSFALGDQRLPPLKFHLLIPRLMEK